MGISFSRFGAYRESPPSVVHIRRMRELNRTLFETLEGSFLRRVGRSAGLTMCPTLPNQTPELRRSASPPKGSYRGSQNRARAIPSGEGICSCVVVNIKIDTSPLEELPRRMSQCERRENIKAGNRIRPIEFREPEGWATASANRFIAGPRGVRVMTQQAIRRERESCVSIYDEIGFIQIAAGKAGLGRFEQSPHQREMARPFAERRATYGRS